MQYDDLITRTRAQLESGLLAPAALERLLQTPDRQSRRPDITGVLVALGLAAAFAGVAVMYAIGFSDLSQTAQMVSPFLFPVAAMGAAVALARAGRPSWEAEAAGLVGQLSLAIAFVVLGGVVDPSDIPVFGAICALAAVAEVLASHRLIGSVRLTGWSLSASLVAAGAFSTAAIVDGSLAYILLGEAVVAAAVTALLASRGSAYGIHAARTAVLLTYGACACGIAQQDGWEHLSGWHLLLTLAVVGTFMVAAALRYDALIWVGGLGGLFWLTAISIVVGDSTGAASMIVLGGLGLVGLGFLIRAMRNITHATGTA